MGITNAAGKNGNEIEKKTYGSRDYFIVNSGNMSKSNIFNDTYTIGLKDEAQNVILLNYTDGALYNSNGDMLYGHSNKFIYDYAQQWSNCGVVSSLNILALAGIKNIVQYTPEELAKNEQIKQDKQNALANGEFYKGGNGVYKNETESAFTLWAIQNSVNDLYYYFKEDYEFDKTNMGYYDDIDDTKIDGSFCLHQYDYTYYKNKNDIQFYDGGSFPWQRSNILKHYGIDAAEASLLIEVVCPTPNILPYLTTKGGNEIYINMAGKHYTFDEAEPAEVGGQKGEPRRDIVIKINNITIDELLKQKYVWIKDGNNAIIQFDKLNTLVLQNYYDTSQEESNSYTLNFGDDKIIDISVLENYCNENNLYIDSELQANRYKYDFVYDLENYFYNGQGLIVSGAAYQFIGKNGGPHAISVVGMVKDTNNDITGFMVIDTGGFLTRTEQAQFISTEMLYKFLTDGVKTDIKGLQTSTIYNYTTNEIRSWADALNLIGNKKKNSLIGNESNNTINGKGGADILYGNGGDDKLIGDSSDDIIYGGEGNDFMSGGSGNDKYIITVEDAKLSANHDTIDVGTGRDEIQFDNIAKSLDAFKFYNKNGDLIITYQTDYTPDTIYSGEEYDIVNGKITTTYTKVETFEEISHDNSVTISGYFSKKKYQVLQTIKLSNDGVVDKPFDFVKDVLAQGYIKYTPEINKANTIFGTAYGDKITGGNYADIIKADKGDDILNGGCGNDTIYAGKNNDIIYGSHGNDQFYNDGNELTLHYKKGEFSGLDTLNTGKGEQIILIEDSTLSADSLKYSKANNDLIIMIDSTTGAGLKIKNYFSKKGKTTATYIEIVKGKGVKNEIIDLLAEYNDIYAKTIFDSKIDFSKSSQDIKIDTDRDDIDGNNLIKTGSGYDTIYGGLGEDTIYAGNGNDTIYGGLNNDKLYGQGGENTYMFNGHAQGDDTIYTVAKSKTIINFSESNIKFNNEGIKNSTFEKFAFTKNKNDLIINYATRDEETGNAQITISNFFKSKDLFTLVDSEGELDLQKATIFFQGEENIENKLTGSNLNDYILGKDKNDTIKSLSGDDTIIGGEGNDNITAGDGKNTIKYSFGDGFDTINLTKNENLSIEIDSVLSKNESIAYRIEKNDLIISTVDAKGKTSDILNIKNFGKKDVTTENGSVTFTYQYTDRTNKVQTKTIDLRNETFLEKYADFTIKNNKFKGSWFSETIDAEILNEQLITNGKGANIDAGAGNDIIYGSAYSDTIKGGNGDDIIFTNQTQPDGKNTVDGGNGSDIYYLFNDKNIRFDEETGADIQYSNENTIIKDTGKNEGDIDTVYINLRKDELYYNSETSESFKNAGKIWFNVDKKGKITNTIYIESFDKKNNATLTNIEKIITSDSYSYNKDNVIADIIEFLYKYNFKDVNTAMKASTKYKEELMGIFSKGWSEYPGQETYTGTDGDDFIKEYGVTGLDIINGKAGNDSIIAGGQIAIVYGQEGNDTIEGQSFNITQEFYGGDGNDLIVNTNEDISKQTRAKLYGEGGNDTLISFAGDDTLIGGAGNDEIQTSGNDLIIIGSNDGADTIYSSGGADTIYFENNSIKDLTNETSGKDLIIKINSNIIPIGTEEENENKIILANFFEDVTKYSGIIIKATDTEEEGISLSEYLAGGALRKEGTNGDDTIEASKESNYELIGLAGNDSLKGSNKKDTLIGGEGDDTLVGTGNDFIIFNTNDGKDTYKYNTNTNDGDTLWFKNVSFSDIKLIKKANVNDLIISYGENDSVTIKNVYTSDGVFKNIYVRDISGTTVKIIDLITSKFITLDGNDENNELNLHYETEGGARIDSYKGNYQISGYKGDDTIYGGAGDNIIDGGEGNDEILGGTGNNTINGGEGDDIIIGNSGNDIITGGTGNDFIVSTDGNDLIILNKGDGEDIYQYWLYKGDTISFTDINIDDTDDFKTNRKDNDLIFEYGDNDKITIQNIYLGNLEDITLNGENGEQSLKEFLESTITYMDGTEGNDTLVAGDESNYCISGGDGNDNITGKAGEDFLLGNKGNDTITGSGNDRVLFYTGDGNDTYKYTESGNDTIYFGDTSFENLTFDKSDKDLIIKYTANDSIKIENAFNDASKLLLDAVIKEQNDSETNLKDFRINYTGTGGDDTIDLSESNVYFTINAGKGNDSITGSGGNIITFQTNDGNDIYKCLNTGNDTLYFTDAEKDDITLVKSDKDLIIKYNTNDNVKIENAFDDDYKLVANAMIKDKNNELITIKEFGITIQGGESNDTLNAGADEGIYILNGGTGDDTYDISSLKKSTIIIDDEDGIDAIKINNTEKSEVKIVFGSFESDLHPDMIVISTSGNPMPGITVYDHKEIERIEIEGTEGKFYIETADIIQLKSDLDTWITSNTEYTNAGDLFIEGTDEQRQTYLELCNSYANWQAM